MSSRSLFGVGERASASACHARGPGRGSPEARPRRAWSLLSSCLTSAIFTSSPRCRGHEECRPDESRRVEQHDCVAGTVVHGSIDASGGGRGDGRGEPPCGSSTTSGSKRPAPEDVCVLPAPIAHAPAAIGRSRPPLQRIAISSCRVRWWSSPTVSNTDRSGSTRIVPRSEGAFGSITNGTVSRRIVPPPSTTGL